MRLGDGRKLVWILTFPLLFGHPQGAETGRALSLREAVEHALAGGAARVLLAREGIELEAARTDLARSALLPHLGGSVTQIRQTTNLEARGLRFEGIIPIPRLVGPYSTFDARAEVRQLLFGWGSLRRYQAARTRLESAELEDRSVQDAVIADVAASYLDALFRWETWQTAESHVQLARRLLDLADRQRQIGTGTRIEVTRAEVQLSQAEHRRLLARTAYEDALLLLKRLTGIDLETSVTLTDRLAAGVVETSLGEALNAAPRYRPDLLAQQKRLEAARLAYRASRADRLPTLSGFLDYGTTGASPSESIPTWAAGVQLNIPVFDGGVVDADRAEKAVAVRIEEIRLGDLERQIGVEIRLAFSALESARGEITLSQQTVEQAGAELEQARRRYQAGVTTSLEVTEAQTRLREAEESRNQALYRYSLARIELADAVGNLREEILP